MPWREACIGVGRIPDANLTNYAEYTYL